MITLIISMLNFHFYKPYTSCTSSINTSTIPSIPGAGPNVLYLYEKTGDKVFAEKYGKPLDKDGLMDENEQVYNNILIKTKVIIDQGAKSLAQHLLGYASDGIIEVNELVEVVKTIDFFKKLASFTEIIEHVDYAFNLSLRLGLVNKEPSWETMFVISNYAVAVKTLNAPEELDNLRLLVSAAETMNRSVLLNFEPIIVKDNLNRNVEIFRDPNIPAEVWIMAKHLGLTPYVLDHPETWFSFNAKIRQNYMDIFYRLAILGEIEWSPPILTFSEKHSLDSKEAWDVIIQQWNYYWYSTPQAGNITQRITVFPWYDSKIQEEWIPNEIDRKIANFVFWQLPLYYYKRDGELITGVKAMKQFLNDMEELYPKIINDYLEKGWEMRTFHGMDFKNSYGHWLLDRGGHGLRYTVSEWIGVDDIYEWDVPGAGSWNKSLWIASMDTTKNGADNIIQRWKYGDLIKWLFTYSLGCADGSKDVGEFINISNQGNRNFRAFGIPFIAEANFFGHYIGSGNNLQTAHGYEPAVFGLPQNLIEELKGKAIILPGNGYAFLSSPNGLRKDIEIGMYDKREPNLRFVDIVFILNPLHWNRNYFYYWYESNNFWYGISLRADNYYPSPTPGS